jgi:methylenetetrahydrofolate reductase (NADPH)
VNIKDHITNKMYHVEVLPPKQNSEKLKDDLKAYAEKFKQAMDSGHVCCVTDNAMGNLSFQGHELIEDLGLPFDPNRVLIHLNTFHSRKELDNILKSLNKLGIRNILAVSGDGNERLPKLAPRDIGCEGVVEAVTSVELMRYISREYKDYFTFGVAFNPYEPEDHEFEKMRRKVDAGATFVITQPIIAEHILVDKLLKTYNLPVILEAWMSKKLGLLSQCVGYEIPETTSHDPIEALKSMHKRYPECGVYLALLSFKNHFPLLNTTWQENK